VEPPPKLKIIYTTEVLSLPSKAAAKPPLMGKESLRARGCGERYAESGTSTLYQFTCYFFRAVDFVQRFEDGRGMNR